MATSTSRQTGGRNAGAANRAALLSAARELYDADGLDVPLSAIARHAGVGQGSLYRHFPDRRSLAVAVFEENMREIEELGASSTATAEDMLRLLTEHSVRSAAFVQIVLAGPADDGLTDIAERVTAVILAKATTSALPLTTAEDVWLGLSMVASVVATAPVDRRQAIADRAWALLGVSL